MKKKPHVLFPALAGSIYFIQDSVIKDLQTYLQSMGIPDHVMDIIESIRMVDVHETNLVEDTPEVVGALEANFEDDYEQLMEAKVFFEAQSFIASNPGYKLDYSRGLLPPDELNDPDRDDLDPDAE